MTITDSTHPPAANAPAVDPGFPADVYADTEGLLAELRAGRMIILTDDAGRENEGDLVAAGELVTPQQINFMIRSAAGKLCLSLPGEICDRLGLHPQTADNNAEHGTAFTVSVDADPRFGVTTGVSASDRCATIHRCIHPDARPEDLRRPGHIAPLRAKDGGVLVRAGHTEASVDLARLAGLRPAGVIIEILNDDGSVARRDDLIAYARRHGLKIGTIADLVEHRIGHEPLVSRVQQIRLPTRWGEFTCIAYRSVVDRDPHLALIKGSLGQRDAGDRPVTVDRPVLVRVHSECLTGDVFGSLRCDCGEQLGAALRMIEQAEEGALVYLRQEGRGIGLFKKLQAYALQEQGLDTIDANLALGEPEDKRDYGIGAQILRDLGVSRIRILTNNPKKVSRLEVYGLTVAEQLPLAMCPNAHNEAYLSTKRDRMGHRMDGGAGG